MGKNIMFFLAGWFSVAIGFEVAPMWGNIAGVVSFVLLVIWFDHRESLLTKRAADGFTAVPNSNLEVNQTVSAKAVVVRRRR
jgi:hypothetical protein